MPYSIKHFFPPRKPWAHKGDFGRVFVVGGSNVHSGSPAFNAIAALRAGADIVTVAGPMRAMNITAAFLPDIITIMLDGDLEPKHASYIIAAASSADALVIGCGLAQNEESYEAIREIILGLDLPMVIDAEAIRAIAENLPILEGKHAVLTPHANEFAALTGEVVSTDDASKRMEHVKHWATELGATILLKGHIDVMSDGKFSLLNETGSPYMTKGGFGDTLAGIAGALLARGASTIEAAYGAAYINGRAGELAAKKFGESLIASDIFAHISTIIAEIRHET